MPDAGGAGGVRIGVAFNDPALDPTPTWTYLTATPNLVASYSIERGAESEFVAVETGVANVEIIDREGVLDPTNAAGPYFGLIEPLLQIRLELLNPTNDTWYVRYRGWIEDLDYTIHPSQKVTFLKIGCVGIMALLAAIEMQPGEFGIVPSPSPGNIVFEAAADVQVRFDDVLGSAGIPTEFYRSFTGNVSFPRNTYSPSTPCLDPLQEAADADLPTVGILAEDRFGRLFFHGRLAELDPEGVIADGPVSSADWDFHHWKAADGAGVALSPSDTAHIRSLSFNRGISSVINSALCTPLGAPEDEIEDGYAKDDTSIGKYGIRSWSAENLILDGGNLTGNNARDECALIAAFVVANNKDPKNRITDLTFLSMDTAWVGAAATWALLCQADISDLIDVTESSDSNNSFSAEPFAVRGVHETAEPLNGRYAMVTLRLDVVPLPSDPAGIDGN